MTFAVKMQLQGAGPALNALNLLPGRLHRRVVTKAVRAGAKPIHKTARGQTPVEFGVMKKAMTTKVKAYRKTVVAIIGPRRRKDVRTGRNPANYAHLVEKGTKPHLIPGGVIPLPTGERIYAVQIAHPGARPRWFMRRSAQWSEGRAMREFVRVLGAEAEKEAKGLVK